MFPECRKAGRSRRDCSWRAARSALSKLPAYQGAVSAFEASGAEVASVAVDRDGLIADRLPDRTTSLLYLTPSHQFPTGGTLSADRRGEIIAWARRQGCYVLEDDYDCDIRYEGSASTADRGAGARLHHLSRNVLQVPRRRIAHRLHGLVPGPIAEAVRSEKCLLGNGTPWLEQATLADFIRTGSYSAHLLRLRAHYKENRDCLVDALRRNFGDVAVDGDQGGLHLVWYPPPGIPDAVTVEATALRARVGVYSFAAAGVQVRAPTALTGRAVLLGYAALSRKQIEKGIARLSDAIDDAIDDPATDMTAYFFPAVHCCCRAAPSGAQPVITNAGTQTSAATGSTPGVASSCTVGADHRATR